ncbi:hypothetical protein GCM10010210_22180 [Pseudonocardia hydrocarbonoxydans]|uniref:Uncharacterized protein n=1 Tax=Pseudonocardia hydrocarbonoxydans TaxID=76726 RepID=A0A4Y3WRH9_9PSEU|nr:hypothetical protein PHY01_37660 [Pseudonocardia hydrocarbonoxydans]
MQGTGADPAYPHGREVGGRVAAAQDATASGSPAKPDSMSAVSRRPRPSGALAGATVSARVVPAASAGPAAAARTRYDHVAGTHGVALFDAQVGAGPVRTRDGLALTGPGQEWFVGLAGGTALRARGSRPARPTWARRARGPGACARGTPRRRRPPPAR